MRVSLTKLEANMLVDAANRMECDDIWDEYTEKQGAALKSAAVKIASHKDYVDYESFGEGEGKAHSNTSHTEG